jgi:NAD(P)-dependent dehydrogenase (short-subunit alcohol dehydrogenase family)
VTRITTKFGERTTAAQVVRDIDLDGKYAIVTGGASGIGIETARALALAGADVTIAVRDTAAGDIVADALAEATGNGNIHVSHLDLSDQASIAAFGENWSDPLDLLINNAGVMAIPELQRTPQGWELQFATNHLGHFALALRLHAALAATPDARVVSVSSSAHLASPVVFDDIHFERRPYDPWSAYAQSKTANVLFAVEAGRRWADDDITVNALMPGGIMTNLQRHIPQHIRVQWAAIESNKTPQQGAATTLVAAVAPEFRNTSGHYLEDCNEAETVANDAETDHRGVREWALDPAVAQRLWDVSLQHLSGTQSSLIT